jgi:hypothetical protein
MWFALLQIHVSQYIKTWSTALICLRPSSLFSHRWSRLSMAFHFVDYQNRNSIYRCALVPLQEFQNCMISSLMFVRMVKFLSDLRMRTRMPLVSLKLTWWSCMTSPLLRFDDPPTSYQCASPSSDWIKGISCLFSLAWTVPKLRR